MILSVALTAWAIAAALLAPSVLALTSSRLRRPGLLLGAWLAAFGSGVLAILAAAVVAVATAVDASVARSIPSEGTGWLLSSLAVITGWVVLGLVGAVVSLVHIRLEPIVLGAAAERRAFDALLEAAEIAEWRVRGVPISSIAVDAPTAFALPGRHPRIVVSSGLVHLLSPPQLDAVIAHERAHLAGHHAVIRRLAQLNRACLPSLTAANDLERSTRLLIELVADDRASRSGRRPALAEALTLIAEATGDEAMRLRARRLAAGH